MPGERSDQERLALRVSDAEREAAVATLRAHYEAGRLSVEELDERTSAASSARTVEELEALRRELPELSPAGRPLRERFGVYLAVNALLVAIWFLTRDPSPGPEDEGAGTFWPVWPILGWGFFLLLAWIRGRDDSRHDALEPPRRAVRHGHDARALRRGRE